MKDLIQFNIKIKKIINKLDIINLYTLLILIIHLVLQKDYLKDYLKMLIYLLLHKFLKKRNVKLPK